jgi:hypothetical protein
MEVARAFVEADEEMPAALAWARNKGLDLRYDADALTVSLALTGPPDEPYLITGDFERYRLLPPTWRFVDPRTGEVIGTAAYPQPQHASVLHPNGLICAHWSRLAYSEHNGPHADWGATTTWQQPKAGTVALTIPDMLARLVWEVRVSNGRMAPLPT